MHNNVPQKRFSAAILRNHLFAILIVLSLLLSPRSLSAEKIALRKHPTQSHVVPNPVDLTKLSNNQMFHIIDEAFTVQFFFNGQDLFGSIVTRQKEQALFLRWCFFRTCEESPYDYNVLLGEPYRAPFEDIVFHARFPPGILYTFQGLKFWSTSR